MTKNQHTPGPWSVERSSTHGILWVDAAAGHRSGVCDLYHTTASEQFVAKDNAEANALLISAAPDLLDACEQLLHELSLQHACSDGECEVCDRIRAKIKNAQSAIAKARGEQK